ncbi:competence protein ComK [Lederbergia citrea]|uniref:Competence protein ComK n=1 Tax=Lederbergia citrea TaxID=2833581 RepID=A0A942UL81_9BACI|nr:competence protein ComK [Lederbergia citrea]MBS4177440.1 competence protein ComK [Lederbergia citrea]MBS4204118.1 competence protein ComK [Lederbergia citrea]MBS4221297.1 competence protein ComK [Lederbergia citrea]
MQENERMVEEYEINPLTMMIKPLVDGKKTYSDIYEFEEKYLSQDKPIQIIKRSCDYFGCSFDGRREGTRKLINITHKVPIIVDPHTSIYLFPTTSPFNPDCIWISHDFVEDYHKSGPYSTIVQFQNNEKYEIPISFSSFGGQLSRAAMLRVKFQQNIERMEGFRRRSSNFYLKASEFQKPYRTKKDEI